MSYNEGAPPKILSVTGTGDGTAQAWIYNTTDDYATCEVAGYFTNGGKVGMKVGNVVYVSDSTNSRITAHRVSSISAAGVASISASTRSVADDVHIHLEIPDIDAAGFSSEDGRFNITSPYAGTITKISVIVNNSVTSETQIDSYINGVSITGGRVTVAASSSQGDITSSEPSAANVIAVNDRIVVASNGAAGSSSRASVLMSVTRA